MLEGIECKHANRSTEAAYRVVDKRLDVAKL